jgi:hypothetical protein
MERCAEVPVADLEDAGWFHNVLLMGGSACIPGLPGAPPCLLGSNLGLLGGHWVLLGNAHNSEHLVYVCGPRSAS